MSAYALATDAPASVAPARSGGVRIGIMPVTALERLTREAGSLLTARERAFVARLKHAGRRSESVAGRLVTKWLVLQQAAAVADGRCAHAWPPEICDITPEALDAVPLRDYARVEILPRGGGAPGLTSTVGAAADTAHVSIAHRGGWAAAAVSRFGPVGVDLEVMAPRGPSFHEGCVSDRERRWLSGVSAADTERLATLLWAVKEACFKTGASRATSVWGIGAIDLDVRTPAKQVAGSLAARPSTRLSSLDLDVSLRAVGRRPRVAYGARGAFTLAVMALMSHETAGP